MNTNLILLPVCLAYLVVAIGLCFEKKYWMAFVFLCYALSNVGLYMISKQ